MYVVLVIVCLIAVCGISSSDITRGIAFGDVIFLKWSTVFFFFLNNSWYGEVINIKGPVFLQFTRLIALLKNSVYIKIAQNISYFYIK